MLRTGKQSMADTSKKAVPAATRFNPFEDEDAVEFPGESPAEIDLQHLQAATHPQLTDWSARLAIRGGPDRTRHRLILDLLKFYAAKEIPISAEGILEMASEGYGFLRWPRYNFAPCPEDVYVSASAIKRLNLRAGNQVQARLRLPRDKEKFMAADEVVSVEGQAVEGPREVKTFEKLTAMFPNQRIILENSKTNSITSRAVDLITPLGRGQRGLIVSPPRAGKTLLLKDMARSIRVTSPEIRLILLLVDERPEEVTDLRRSVDAEIFCSTFDEPPTRHVQISELVSERAKRLVEIGEHVVILIDSLTRLARGYNAIQSGKGRIMSGGVESKALLKPKRFFGAARNVEEGGSLTVVATALIDTESRMDEVIFEEFKGTGNMELHLDRALLEKRVFPAIHVLMSGTRKEELLYHPDELQRIHILRKQLAALPPIEAMEVLLRNLKATRTNAELLLTGLR